MSYGVRICYGSGCRCANVAGGPFAGLGAHRGTCIVGVEWARARLVDSRRSTVDVGQDLRHVFGLRLVFPPPPWSWAELPGWGTAMPARGKRASRGPVRLVVNGLIVGGSRAQESAGSQPAQGRVPAGG